MHELSEEMWYDSLFKNIPLNDPLICIHIKSNHAVLGAHLNAVNM